MPARPNVLVVCGRNKKRSRTAEYIFKNDNRFNIRSAGLSPSSERKISEKDLQWANLVLVMVQDQRGRLKSLFPGAAMSKIIVLDIEDDYEFLDEELIQMLTDKINATLASLYQI